MKFEAISRHGEVLEVISADSKLSAERIAKKKYDRRTLSFVKEVIEDEGRIVYEKMIAYVNRHHDIDRNGDILGSIVLGNDLAWSEAHKPEFTESEKNAGLDYARFMGKPCYDKVAREFS